MLEDSTKVSLDLWFDEVDSAEIRRFLFFFYVSLRFSDIQLKK